MTAKSDVHVPIEQEQTWALQLFDRSKGYDRSIAVIAGAGYLTGDDYGTADSLGTCCEVQGVETKACISHSIGRCNHIDCVTSDVNYRRACNCLI